jgi:hypothetical protein
MTKQTSSSKANKQLTPVKSTKSTLPVLKKSPDEIRNRIRELQTNYDPERILIEANKEFDESPVKNQNTDPENSKDRAFKALTLHEFHHGVLLATVVPEQYRSFGIEFSRQLQKEHDCQTPSEKSLAEVTALNYIRILESQRKINNYMQMGTITDNGAKFLKIMSQELDRAHRHYLTSLQTLKSIKQPPMQLNIRTNTTVVGQNQMVQVNDNEINKAK